MYLFCSICWLFVLPDFSSHISRDGSDSPANGRIAVLLMANELLSSALLTPVCSTLMQSNTGSAVTHVHVNAPYWLLRAVAFYLGLNKVQTFSGVTSYASLCLLNLRASRRLSLREKSKKHFKQILLLTSISFSYFLHHRMILEGRKWRRLSVFMPLGCCCWSWFGSVKMFSSW